MLKNRNVALVIVFSIITCGIYLIYWTYVTMDALDKEGQSSNMPVIAQFLLCFFAVGYLIFGINANANINAIKQNHGLPTQDNTALWLILGLLFPIVLIAIVQNEINQLVPN